MDRAVTGSPEGGANRKPLRMLNVYVRPPLEGVGSDSASSGTSLAPAMPSSSG